MRRTRACIFVAALTGGCFNPPARDSDPGTTTAPGTTTTTPVTTGDATSCASECQPTTAAPTETTSAAQTTDDTAGDTSTTAEPGEAFFQVASIAVDSPFALVAGQFDPFANLDLMVTSSKSGITRISNSSGSYMAEQVLPEQPSSLAIAVTNFDEVDIYDDFIVASDDANIYTFLTVNPGTPVFQWMDAAPCATQNMVFADLVDDASLDIAFACAGMTQVFAYPGTGGSGFITPFVTRDTMVTIDALAAANLFGTPATDIIIASTATGQALVLPRLDNDTFGPALPFPLMAPSRLAVDLTGGSEYHNAVVSTATGCYHLAGGDGAISSSGPFDCSVGVVQLAIANLDDDASADLVSLSADLDNPTVNVYKGNGAGDFTHLATYDVGKDPRRLVLADLDADERPDIAVTTGSAVDIFHNNL